MTLIVLIQVWAIFAPKILFDFGTALATDVLVAFSYVLALRWIRRR